jgi:hypothetical protein
VWRSYDMSWIPVDFEDCDECLFFMISQGWARILYRTSLITMHMHVTHRGSTVNPTLYYYRVTLHHAVRKGRDSIGSQLFRDTG